MTPLAYRQHRGLRRCAPANRVWRVTGIRTQTGRQSQVAACCSPDERWSCGVKREDGKARSIDAVRIQLRIAWPGSDRLIQRRRAARRRRTRRCAHMGICTRRSRSNPCRQSAYRDQRPRIAVPAGQHHCRRDRGMAALAETPEHCYGLPLRFHAASHAPPHQRGACPRAERSPTRIETWSVAPAQSSWGRIAASIRLMKDSALRRSISFKSCQSVKIERPAAIPA